MHAGCVARGSGGGAPRDRGMVTAELALAIPVMLVVLAMGLEAVRVGIDEVRCVDAARQAARALARGETEAWARAVAARAGPAGAVVRVGASGSEVTVEVSAARELAGMRVLTVRGSATALTEQP